MSWDMYTLYPNLTLGPDSALNTEIHKISRTQENNKQDHDLPDSQAPTTWNKIRRALSFSLKQK